MQLVSNHPVRLRCFGVSTRFRVNVKLKYLWLQHPVVNRVLSVVLDRPLIVVLDYALGREPDSVILGDGFTDIWLNYCFDFGRPHQIKLLSFLLEISVVCALLVGQLQCWLDQHVAGAAKI